MENVPFLFMVAGAIMVIYFAYKAMQDHHS